MAPLYTKPPIHKLPLICFNIAIMILHLSWTSVNTKGWKELSFGMEKKVISYDILNHQSTEIGWFNCDIVLTLYMKFACSTVEMFLKCKSKPNSKHSKQKSGSDIYRYDLWWWNGPQYAKENCDTISWNWEIFLIYLLWPLQYMYNNKHVIGSFTFAIAFGENIIICISN